MFRSNRARAVGFAPRGVRRSRVNAQLRRRRRALNASGGCWKLRRGYTTPTIGATKGRNRAKNRVARVTRRAQRAS